jgi:1,5-anhydro-D-fructose reductase (1,5-anhydro-D-mannitol-forming)
MGMNAAECRQMVEAARNRKVVLGIAHVFRFNESVLKLRDMLAAGQVGAPVFARCEFSFFAAPNHARTWLHDASLAGAGPIFDVGVHCIDTLRFILQDEVVRVSCTASSDPRSGDVESAASLTLKFAKGTIGTVLVSFRAEYRTPLEIVGQTGTLFAENALNVEHPVEVQLRRDSKVVESITASNTDVYTLQVDAFADAIEGRSQFPIPGEDGWQNQEILDAALRSMKSGATEPVPRVGF